MTKFLVITWAIVLMLLVAKTYNNVTEYFHANLIVPISSTTNPNGEPTDVP